MIERREFLRITLAAGAWHSLPAAAQVGGNVSSIVVSFPAGGISDIFARSIAPAMAQSLGRTIVVENITGASGSIASDKVLAAKPQGQAMLMGSPTETILAPATLKSARYQPADFKLLGLLSHEPLALYVRGDLPVASVDELVAHARQPGMKPLTYASAGVGSLYHLAGEDFRLASGLPLLHVPYRGGTPMLQDLMSGVVDMVLLPTVGDMQRRTEGGKIRAIAVANTKRSPLFPQAATFAESKAMPTFTTQSVWVGLMVPASTPAGTATQLHQALHQALQQPAVRQAVEAAGGPVPPAMSMEQAAAFYATETTRLRAALKAAQIEPS